MAVAPQIGAAAATITVRGMGRSLGPLPGWAGDLLEAAPIAPVSLMGGSAFNALTYTLNAGAEATPQGALHAAGISLTDPGVIPTLRVINKPAPT